MDGSFSLVLMLKQNKYTASFKINIMSTLLASKGSSHHPARLCVQWYNFDSIAHVFFLKKYRRISFANFRFFFVGTSLWTHWTGIHFTNDLYDIYMVKCVLVDTNVFNIMSSCWCVHLCACVCVYSCVYLCVWYTCMPQCMHIRTYIHTCIRSRTHEHT